jgi:hypothetical protein
MCDYSLHAVKSRPAKVDDKLITTSFPNSVTNGLAGVGEPQVAVCLLPGTEVAFDEDVKHAHPLLWFRHRTMKERVARFRQVNMGIPHTHHDALEFPSGKLVFVTSLIANQSLTVLQLPVSKRNAAAEDHTSTAPSMPLSI